LGNSTMRALFFASSMYTGAALLAVTGAHAAIEAPNADAGTDDAIADRADPAAEPVLTGSRIQQPNMVSAVPVVVVSDTEIKFEGVTNVESCSTTRRRFVTG